MLGFKHGETLQLALVRTPEDSDLYTLGSIGRLRTPRSSTATAHVGGRTWQIGMLPGRIWSAPEYQVIDDAGAVVGAFESDRSCSGGPLRWCGRELELRARWVASECVLVEQRRELATFRRSRYSYKTPLKAKLYDPLIDPGLLLCAAYFACHVSTEDSG
jgi:hypothetical protein